MAFVILGTNEPAAPTLEDFRLCNVSSKELNSQSYNYAGEFEFEAIALMLKFSHALTYFSY